MSDKKELVYELCLQACKSEEERITFTADSKEEADSLYELCVKGGYERVVYRLNDTQILISQYV